MSNEIERLLVRVEADIRQFKDQMDKANRASFAAAAKHKKAMEQMQRDTRNAAKGIADQFRIVPAAAGIAFGAIVAASYDAAKSAQAINGAFNDAFKNMRAEAQATAAQIAGDFGRLETDVKDNLTRGFNILQALGLDAEKAFAAAAEMQKRALDLAAQYDTTDAEAFRAILSGITGETEPMKRFGVVLNETAVKAELLSMGFKGNASNASESAKAIARLNVMLKASEAAKGAVARESDGLSEQEKRLRAEFQKTAQDLGTEFLPVAADVLKWATEALRAFNRMPSGAQAAALGMLGLVAAGGPIAKLVGGLVNLIRVATQARAALAGVAAANAAVGASGVAGVGGRAGLGGGLLLGTGVAMTVASGQDRADARTRGDLSKASDEALAAALRRSQGDLAYYDSRNRNRSNDLNARNREIVALRIKSLEAEIARRAAAVVDKKADEAIAEALKETPVFDLDGVNLNAAGAGGGGGGGGGSARQPKPIEVVPYDELSLLLQEDIENNRLAIQLETARLTKNEQLIKALERELTLRQLIADYTATGLTSDEARLSAELEASRRNVADMIHGDEFTKDRLDEFKRSVEEQAKYQRERIATEREAFGQALAGAFRDKEAFLRDVMQRVMDGAAQSLGQTLYDVLRLAFGAQSGWGGETMAPGWLSAAANVLGFRAQGGPVQAGKPYIVGEKGPELMIPGGSGTVLNNPALRDLASPAARPVSLTTNVYQTVNLQANGDKNIVRLVDAAARRAHAQAVRDSAAAVPGVSRQHRLLEG